jgi:membrane protease YdiL (CAAX protease family)
MFVMFGVLLGVPEILFSFGTGRPAAVKLAAALLGVVVAVGIYVLAVRFMERRPVVELERDGAVRGLVVGVLLGVGLFSVVIGVIAALGGYRVVGTGTVGGVVSLFAASLFAGVVEELVFRGVVFRVLEELTGTWWALALSAALFGGLHFGNPGATAWGALAIAIEAGVLLGAAYVATRRLWVPIGLHFAWNFTQGGVFGVTVSGSGEGGEGLLTSRLSGPDLLSGGAFGAEASIFAVLLCLLLAVLFLRIAVRAGRIKPPRWSAPAKAAAARNG